MMKTERIYRELLLLALSRVTKVRQTDLAEKCGVSLGLTNKTIAKLEAAGAVEATKRGVRILSPPRILNLWAAERRVARDVIDSFRIDPLERVEKELPRGAVLTGFSGWSSLTGSRPAEYSRVYFYIANRSDYEEWFEFRRARARKTNPNVFVLLTDDQHLLSSSKRGIAPVPQLYVDIYSIGGPEAPPYLKDILEAHPELSLW